jgi:hypothetical protein
MPRRPRVSQVGRATYVSYLTESEIDGMYRRSDLAAAITARQMAAPAGPDQHLKSTLEHSQEDQDPPSHTS